MDRNSERQPEIAIPHGRTSAPIPSASPFADGATIRPLLSEFHNPEQESLYQAEAIHREKYHHAFILIAVGATFLFSALIDFMYMTGDHSGEIPALVLARALGATAFFAAAAIALAEARPSRVYGSSIAALFLMVACYSYIATTYFALHDRAEMPMVFALLGLLGTVFVPLPMRYALAFGSVLFAVATVFNVGVFDQPPERIASVTVLVGATCVIGLFFSSFMNRLRRQEFATRQHLESANDQLRVEIDRRTGAEIELEQQRDALQQLVEERTANLRLAMDAAGLDTWRWDIRANRIESSFSQPHLPDIVTIEDFLSQVIPEDRPRVEDAIEEARIAGGDYSYEFRTKLDDGSLHWVLIKGRMFLDAHGEAYLSTGVDMDITRTKEAEHALRESEAALAQANQLLHHVLDALPIRVFWKDRDSVYLGCNKYFADDAGFSSPADIVGKTDRDLPWKSDAERYRSDDARVIESGIGDPPTESLETALSGTSYWIRLMRTPLRDGAGNCIGVLGAYEDITAQKKLAEERNMFESQLIRAQKLETVGQLAGGIAHDFNNLLVAALGYAEMGENDADATPEIQRYFAEIRAVAERAAELTKQLLALGRRQVLSVEPLDLSNLVRDTAGMLKRVLPESIELNVVYANGPAVVMGDAGQLEQVLLNLVLNARDAMPNGGTVTIEVDANPTRSVARPERPDVMHESVELRIRDSGGGIGPEDLPNIFEPFYTTKPEGKGTGLGLAVVLGIVEQHRGQISLDSQPNQGTEFRILLEKIQTAPAESPTEEPEAIPTGSESVLVVEDNFTVRTLVCDLLRQAGYNVLTANDGEEAVERVQTEAQSIDLILMDVVMPRLSGPEAYERIRTIAPEIPTIFSSGYAADNLPTDFLAKHNLSLIPKPFRAQTLLESIRKALDAAEARP